MGKMEQKQARTGLPPPMHNCSIRKIWRFQRRHAGQEREEGRNEIKPIRGETSREGTGDAR